MAELKTIESYEGYNGNHEGFVAYSVAVENLTAIELYLLCDKAKHTQDIGGEIYYRCGVFSDPIGTIVPREMLEPFFAVFGQDLLTTAEIATLQAANQPESEDM